MADTMLRITSMLEKARDMGLEAAAAASARLADTPGDLRPQEVSKLLSSKSDRDILKGLKYVISVLSSGEDASQFFTDVVKNVTSANLSVRKLVYSYLLRYADTENDTALLSVNAIQKSLADSNEQVRALGIRVMSEIRISSIYQIVLLGIKKCSTDPSARVRRAAAISLINVYNNYGSSVEEEMIGFIKQLLKDHDVTVLSSAVFAYRTICHGKYELLHGHFRRLCSMMTDFDEWTQIYVTEALTSYSRLFLLKPKIINTASNDDSFIELPEIYNEIPFPVYDVEFDPDLKLFLDAIRPLVYSRNEAVILAIGRAFFHLTPPKTFKEAQIAASFLRCLLTSRKESRVFILQSILHMAIHDPTIFVQYEKRFYLLPSDDVYVAKYKLKVLSSICNENNIKTIAHELQYYALHSSDPRIAIESVKAIGICSQISEYWNSKTLKWLLNEVSAPKQDPAVTSELLTVVRYLVQQNPRNNVRTVVKLAHLLEDQSLANNAKESIIWLVGEFSEIEPMIGPDVLRKLIKNFCNEISDVRYQIIMLASKVYSHDLENYKRSTGDSALENYNYDNIVSKMFNYTIKLGRYDDVFDIRDRSRMLYTLLSSSHTQLATLLLQAPKPVPLVTLKRNSDGFTKNREDGIGSLPIEDIVKDYNSLVAWSDSESRPPSTVRDPIDVKEVAKSIGQRFSTHARSSQTVHSAPPTEKKYKLQSLDDFFANESPKGNPQGKKIVYEEKPESEDSGEESGDSESDESEEEDEEQEEPGNVDAAGKNSIVEEYSDSSDSEPLFK